MTPIVDRLRQMGLTAADAAAEFGVCAEPGSSGAGDDDRVLLQRYIDTGSEEAFSQLVYRHAGWIYHTCRRSLRDSHLAEDATQAVFLLLSRKAGSIKPSTHLGGWLFQASRYVLADLRKHRARYLRRQDLACELTLQRCSCAERAGPATESELSVAVDQAIAGLRESDRQTILMHFYEGLTLRQMAMQLSITREGAKKRVMRALARLRKQLAGKVDPARKGTIISATAIGLLLRARGVEAAPVDFVAAVAKSAAIPGLSSTLAKVIVEGVSRSAIQATNKLMARLTLSATALSLAILGTVPLRSHGDGSRSAVIGELWSYIAHRTPQPGTATAVASLPRTAAGWDLDDANPGPSYQHPSEAAAAPLLDLDGMAENGHAARAPSAAGTTAQPPALAAVSVPSSSSGGTASITAAPAVGVALALPPAHPRSREAFEFSEPVVVVQAAPVAGPLIVKRHTAPDPSDADNHRPADAPDPPPRMEPPESRPPVLPGDDGMWHRAPGPTAGNPRGAQPGQPVVVGKLPPTTEFHPPDPGDYRPWPTGPVGGEVVVMIESAAFRPPIERGFAGGMRFHGPAKGWVSTSSPYDAVVSFAMKEGWPVPVVGFGPDDALPADVLAGIAAFSKGPDGGEPPAIFGFVGESPAGLSWGGSFAEGNVMSRFVRGEAAPEGMMVDAVIVPEPAGALVVGVLLSVLVPRRRRIRRDVAHGG